MGIGSLLKVHHWNDNCMVDENGLLNELISWKRQTEGQTLRMKYFMYSSANSDREQDLFEEVVARGGGR